jgi:hypothetical protein
MELLLTEMDKAVPVVRHAETRRVRHTLLSAKQNVPVGDGRPRRPHTNEQRALQYVLLFIVEKVFDVRAALFVNVAGGSCKK